jgi:hypothetical protein
MRAEWQQNFVQELKCITQIVCSIISPMLIGANRPKLKWLRHSILSINPPPRYINPTVFADMLLQKSPGSSTYLATGGPETPKPTLQCWDHDCKGRKFSSRANLLRHKKTYGKKTTTCESCNKSFSRSEHLKYHRATSCKALQSDRHDNATITAATAVIFQRSGTYDGTSVRSKEDPHASRPEIAILPSSNARM